MDVRQNEIPGRPFHVQVRYCEEEGVFYHGSMSLTLEPAVEDV